MNKQPPLQHRTGKTSLKTKLRVLCVSYHSGDYFRTLLWNQSILLIYWSVILVFITLKNLWCPFLYLCSVQHWTPLPTCRGLFLQWWQGWRRHWNLSYLEAMIVCSGNLLGFRKAKSFVEFFFNNSGNYHPNTMKIHWKAESKQRQWKLFFLSSHHIFHFMIKRNPMSFWGKE